MACNLSCVPPARVGEVWPLVNDFIEAAMKRLQLDDFEKVKHNLFNGNALLWVAWEIDAGVKAAAVTHVTMANGSKYCTIEGCGGYDRDEWLPLIHGLEVYAKQEGCCAMRIYGRRGWMRVLPDYKMKAVVLERTL